MGHEAGAACACIAGEGVSAHSLAVLAAPAVEVARGALPTVRLTHRVAGRWLVVLVEASAQRAQHLGVRQLPTVLPLIDADGGENKDLALLRHPPKPPQLVSKVGALYVDSSSNSKTGGSADTIPGRRLYLMERSHEGSLRTSRQKTCMIVDVCICTLGPICMHMVLSIEKGETKQHQLASCMTGPTMSHSYPLAQTWTHRGGDLRSTAASLAEISELPGQN